MLHDLANDGGYVALKRADREDGDFEKVVFDIYII